MKEMKTLTIGENTYEVVDEYARNDIDSLKQSEAQLQSEMSGVKSEIVIERERISNIVSVHEGSTEGNAELLDIRVGYDGTTYQTAGDAVRGQMCNIDSKLGLIATFEQDEFQPVNVLDGIAWGDSGTYWSDSGSIVSTTATASYTALSELIPVTPEQSFSSLSFAGEIKFLNASKKKIEAVVITSPNQQYQFSGNPPSDSAYMAVSFIKKTGTSFNNVQILRTTPTDEEKRWKAELNIPDNSIGFNKIAEDALSVISPLRGKVIVNFGDSIFGNRRPPDDISTELARLTGATVYNCGFGGCRMSAHNLTNYGAFSMFKLADAIASGNWDEQDSGIANTTQGEAVPSYFADSLAILKGLNFSDVDIITIAYGTNDFAASVNMENENDTKDTATFAGALRYSIETLLNAYPHLKIFVCSQTYRFWMDSSNVFTKDSDTKTNSDSAKLTDFVAKTEEVAKAYHLPYINNYDIGMNKYNRSYYFSATDGTHPLIIGCKLIAANIAKYLF